MLANIIDPETLVLALVGNKCDDIHKQEVSLRDAQKLKQQIGAQIFLECSAKDNINIEKLFDEMSKLLMEKNYTVSPSSADPLVRTLRLHRAGQKRPR